MMMQANMLILPGAAALSDFRIDKLQRKLRGIDPAIGLVSARFVHLVELKKDGPKDHSELVDAQMLKGGRQKNFLEPSEAWMPRPSLQGCIHGVFRESF